MMKHFFQRVGDEDWFSFQDLYKEAVSRTPTSGILIEVGVWKGRSLAFLIVESINSGKQHQIIGIDNFIGGLETIKFLGKSDLFEVTSKNLAPVHQHFQLVRGDSAESAKVFKDDSIDFVFIDAAHDYDNVKRDITAWLPKIKPGGMIAGHDYIFSAGVAKAADEIFGSKVIQQEASWKVYL